MDSPAIKAGCTFGEAFMLMTYYCESGRHQERVWNSRDGITPFTIDCRECEGSATHKRWSEDVYDPGFQPTFGMRIFVTLDPEKALQHRIEFVEKWWDPEDPAHFGIAMKDHPFLGPMGKEAAAAHLAAEDAEQYGNDAPDLIEVTEGVLHWLQRSR